MKLDKKRTQTLFPRIMAGLLLVFFVPWVSAQDPEKKPENASNSAALLIESATLETATPEQADEAPRDLLPRRGIQNGRIQGRGNGLGPRPRGDGLGPYGRGQGEGRMGEPYGLPLRGMGPNGPHGEGRGGEGRMGRANLRDQIESPERMRSLRRDSPELADLIEKIQRTRYQIDSIASQGTEAKSETDQNRLKKKLQPLFEEEFDLELKRQDMEIDLMEKRIQQLRNSLQKRKELRERIIGLKINQLLQNPPSPPRKQEILEPQDSPEFPAQESAQQESQQ